MTTKGRIYDGSLGKYCPDCGAVKDEEPHLKECDGEAREGSARGAPGAPQRSDDSRPGTALGEDASEAPRAPRGACLAEGCDWHAEDWKIYILMNKHATEAHRGNGRFDVNQGRALELMP